MERQTQQEWARIFVSYNAALAESYDRNLARLMTDEDHLPDDFDLLLETAVHNDLQNWFDELSPTENRGGAAIDAVSSMSEAIEIAIGAAAICDDGLPDRIKIMLGRFLPDISSPIVDLIQAHVWPAGRAPSDLDDNRSDEMGSSTGDIATSVFLRLLGEWQIEAGLDHLLDQFTQAEYPDEMFADAFRAYLIALGDAAISPVLAAIDREDRKGRRLRGPGEYLLIALTDIGKDHPDEAIYRCLKNSFLTMENQTIGTICLGDYGDGRAVAFLRGWVLKHPEVTDKGILSEIYSSIKRLGGQYDDLPRIPNADRRS
jgi:hypothetical protein